ncbi:MAG: serine/threonine protein kinase [Lachnospiraceae bacterium]|nr:serine/threonine protein kinase [Lachnospiraceae bacterium]
MHKQEERFEIKRLLGSGATAQVYLAYDRLLKRKLAIKWGREKVFLRQEAELLAGFSTPFFPMLYDYTEWEGAGLLFMEYIEGENLLERKTRIDCFTEEEALGIAVKTAKALACLHTCRTPYVYGDLKPENIMIRADGSLKLIDFGAAVSLGREEGSHIGERRGGTPFYAPPEQWRGRPDVRNDIYGLGRLLQDMLKMGRGGILSQGSRRLIERCVQKQPEKRYASVEAFLKEAEVLLKAFQL